MSPRRRRVLARSMQMVFQDPISSLRPRRTVDELVREPLDIWHVGTSEDRRRRVGELLDSVGLDPATVGNRRPGELSGGQCQRVSIARALALDPGVLICDETVSALDVSVQGQILNLLNRLKRDLGLTMLFVSHDLAVIRNVSDRVVVMYLGKVCEVGGTKSLYGAPAHSELGFDRPLPQRYGEWIGDAIRGDLGQSFRTHRDVTDTIRQRLPVTLQLAVMAELMALLVSIPLAVFMARRPGSIVDRATSTATSALIAAPSFLIGVLVIYFLGLRFAVFPVISWVPLTESVGDNLRHAFLPALTIALSEIAVFTRLLRTDLVATLQEGYILAARARGLGSRYIMFRHALRPSSFSLLTLAGVSFGRLLGGTVIAEQMFGLPGIGLLAIDSITGRDLVVVQGIVVVVAVAYIVINAVVDLTYTWLDPRRRVTA